MRNFNFTYKHAAEQPFYNDCLNPAALQRN